MLRKTLQSTLRNLRDITRVVSHESYSNIQTKHYSRFTPRHATIVNEDELFDVNIDNTTSKQPKRIRSRTVRSKAQEVQKEFDKLQKEPYIKNKDGSYDELKSSESIEVEKVKSGPQKVQSGKEKVKKTQNKRKTKQPTQEEGMIGDSKIVYTKVEENEKIMSSIIMDLKNKKRRKKKEQILLEGTRFIKDAIAAGINPQIIIFSRWEDMKKIDISEKKTKFYKVPYKSIQMWSTLTTAPGIMGIFDKPAPKAKAQNSLPITIVCDNIRDPGNMGSILRAAAGVGCEKVLLTKGCVDFWDSKVLRSAAGAHFRIPIHGPTDWDEIKSSINKDANVYVADNNAEDFIEELEASEEMEEYPEEIIDEKESNDDKEAKLWKSKKKNNQTLALAHDLPVVPYYAVDYTQREVVLIVGGETEGISTESYNLVQDRRGTRVNVPLDNKIDSLNAGTALGIVAFEVKRQFLLVSKKLNELPK